MTDYLVMTVKANDSDEGTNGKVLYHLQVSVGGGAVSGCDWECHFIKMRSVIH